MLPRKKTVVILITDCEKCDSDHLKRGPLGKGVWGEIGFAAVLSGVKILKRECRGDYSSELLHQTSFHIKKIYLPILT
jgi:hypothetical protein